MALPPGLHAASFRGVPFEARELGRAVGRRVVVHEYPRDDDDPTTNDQEAPSTQDLGRATRRWRLQAFVVAGDAPGVATLRNALVAACERRGPADLVHPTEGLLRVRCEACEVGESSDALHYAEFSLSFVEAGRSVAETVVPAVTAVTWSATFRSAMQAFFATRLQVLSVARKVNRLFTADVEGRALALLGLADQLTGTDLSDYRYAVEVIADTAATLSRDATSLATSWDGVFVGGTAEDWRRLAGVSGDWHAQSAAAAAVPAATDTDQIVTDNRALQDLLVYTLALAHAAAAAVEDEYEAYDDALAVQLDLGDRLADIEPFVDDLDAATALAELRVALVSALQETALEQPRVRDLEVPVVRCALEVAYDLYGDAARVEQLVLRNALPDPNAVCGPLQVLTS